jgi:hypothetical protein
MLFGKSSLQCKLCSPFLQGFTNAALCALPRQVSLVLKSEVTRSALEHTILVGTGPQGSHLLAGGSVAGGTGS